jgi:aryl-alcohol dehydrogenase-like predicted oxidoreductase
MGLRRRNLGKTGLTVSEMSLGTWGLSGDAYGPVDDREQERVLARAIDMGFTSIDTADVYGAGRMERLVGRAIADRDDVFVVTKGGTDRATLPARKRFDPAYLRAAVERSLRRLGRDRIDVYLLHNPPVATIIRGEAIGALDDMKRDGKIGHWGVSVGDVDVGRESLRRGAEVIEIAYNLLHGSDLHRLAGEVVVAGAGVLARSTLAHGLLAGNWGKNHEFVAGDHRVERWTKDEFERRIDQLDALRFLLGRDVPTMSSAAVRFVLSSSIVSSAVLGPRSVVQLEDLVRNVGLGPVYLRDSELARLPRALEAVGVES